MQALVRSAFIQHHGGNSHAMSQSKPTAHQQAAFRDIFRGHPASVALITATVDGEPVGITVSSVASLSLDPLSISFSFMKRTGSAERILRSESQLVHFLSDAQSSVAKSFAKPSPDRFSEEQGWQVAETGEPFLPNSRAVLRVNILDAARAGESTLIAAEVTDVLQAPNLADPEHQVPALIFKDRHYFSGAQLGSKDEVG
ncbi:flavin oxidoreductase [Corynebacterium sp. HMSC28B08]|nr:flavin oxidoreductase [Corynebacterium sp. HMSC28B08]